MVVASADWQSAMVRSLPKDKDGRPAQERPAERAAGRGWVTVPFWS